MTKLFSHQTPHLSQRDQRKEPKSYSTYWIEKMKEKKKKNSNLSAHLFQKKEVEIQGTRLYPHDS
jgi:broad specificity polyphosphatase/5'/3'-nucleotidase SurE